MSQPQAVDVYHADRWVPGSLLGWRHEDGGTCRLMVRWTADGMEKSVWAELGNVRLPEGGTGGATYSAGGDDLGSAGSRSMALDLSHTDPPPTGRALDRWLAERARRTPSGAGRHRAPDTGIGALV